MGFGLGLEIVSKGPGMGYYTGQWTILALDLIATAFLLQNGAARRMSKVCADDAEC